MVAARIANLAAGDNQHSGNGANLPDLLGDSKPTPVPVSAATDISKLSEPEQQQIDLSDTKAVLNAVKAIRAAASMTGASLISVSSRTPLLPRCFLQKISLEIGNSISA